MESCRIEAVCALGTDNGNLDTRLDAFARAPIHGIFYLIKLWRHVMTSEEKKFVSARAMTHGVLHIERHWDNLTIEASNIIY